MSSFQAAFERLDEFVEGCMRAKAIPGVALALTDRDGLLHVATYGYADVGTGTPVRPETLFEIGSISKSFTSAALMQLREAGLVDVHRPVTDYLPWLEVQSQYDPITLHHLLSHTAGLPHGAEHTTEARCAVWELRQMEVPAPPGEHFHYSNEGYKALGLVLEEVLGQPYGDIIQERLLDPLGMGDTDPVITHDTRRRMAVGYERFYDDRPSHPTHPLVPATWFQSGTGDGAIASTAGDMAAYLRMWLNRGQGPEGRILSEESFDLMTQCVIAMSDEPEGYFYGYGLATGYEDGHTYVGHDGGMVGYISVMLGDMDEGLGAVALMNVVVPGDPLFDIARFALKLLRMARHGEELPPVPLPPDPTRVEKAADYAGVYQAGERALTLTADGDRLFLEHNGGQIPLEARGDDCFYARHPDFALFLLRFGREEGQVVEVFNGPEWYVSDRYTGPDAFCHPPEWVAYPGHYCSHNPWYTNFRVVLRKGALALVDPSGDEEPLTPLGEGVFRVGEDEHCPERLRFGTIINGQAVRANLSLCDYYRTFTP